LRENGERGMMGREEGRRGREKNPPFKKSAYGPGFGSSSWV